MKKTLEQKLQDAQNQVELIKQQIVAKKKHDKPKNIWETVKSLPIIYKKLGANPKKDLIKIDKFDADDIEFLKAIVIRMRICKVYNNKILPKKGIRRWFPWYYLSSSGSGLAFCNSCYNVADANLSSAARLSFLEEAASTACAKNFKQNEEKIIGL